MNLVTKATLNSSKLEPFPFEKELSMESFLIENSEILDFQDEDFPIPEHIECECHLKDGRCSKGKKKNGRLDIVVNYNNATLAIVELKLDEINDVSKEQINDYLKNLSKEELEKLNKMVELPVDNQQVVGILAAQNIAIPIKESMLKNLSMQNSVIGKIPVFGMEIRRFKRNADVFVFTDIYRPSKLGKDYTKYEWNGKIYAKNQLVLAIVKDYVSRNNIKKLEKLKEAFPKVLTGKVFDVVTCWSDVKDERRWHIKTENQIKLENDIVVVCNQWNKDNIKKFISHVCKLNKAYENINEVK